MGPLEDGRFGGRSTTARPDGGWFCELVTRDPTTARPARIRNAETTEAAAMRARFARVGMGGLPFRCAREGTRSDGRLQWCMCMEASAADRVEVIRENANTARSTAKTAAARN